MARVHVHGADELRRTLRKSGVDLAQLKQANRAAAASILPISIAAAPVGTPTPLHWARQHTPGTLKSSLRVGATQKAGIIRAGRKSIPYAGPIHFGWRARNIKPNPWITRAVEANEPVWVRVYMEHINDVIDQIKGI